MRRPTETNKRLKPFSPEIKPPPGAFAIALCGTFLLAGALSCQLHPGQRRRRRGHLTFYRVGDRDIQRPRLNVQRRQRERRPQRNPRWTRGGRFHLFRAQVRGLRRTELHERSSLAFGFRDGFHSAHAAQLRRTHELRRLRTHWHPDWKQLERSAGRIGVRQRSIEIRRLIRRRDGPIPRTTGRVPTPIRVRPPRPAERGLRPPGTETRSTRPTTAAFPARNPARAAAPRMPAAARSRSFAFVSETRPPAAPLPKSEVTIKARPTA
jgi:hypothetical protein